MTGIALWADNEAAATAPIQLAFQYLTYAEAITGPQQYDWTRVEQPGEQRMFTIAACGSIPKLTIGSDRLVARQWIEFEADLP
jgi:hypothetical protein